MYHYVAVTQCFLVDYLSDWIVNYLLDNSGGGGGGGATGLGVFWSWEYLLKKQWGYSWVALFFTSHFQPLNVLKYLCNQSKLCLLNLLIILVRN